MGACLDWNLNVPPTLDDSRAAFHFFFLKRNVFFFSDYLLDNIKQAKWNETRKEKEKKTINKVWIDSVMVDMNRLVRKCLKAFFFSSFLNNFLFFSLSFYLISLFSISFRFLCLFLGIVHIMSQNHALSIKTERVSAISMRRISNRMS